MGKCRASDVSEYESVDTARFSKEQGISELKAKQIGHVDVAHCGNKSNPSKFPYPYLNVLLLQQRPLDVLLLNAEKIPFEDLFRTSIKTLLKEDWHPKLHCKSTKISTPAQIFTHTKAKDLSSPAHFNTHPKAKACETALKEEHSRRCDIPASVWIKNTTIFLPNGDIYSGEQYLSWKHGSGVYLWKDGRAYAGFWYKNKRHGWGVFLLKNGWKYEGFWKGDKKHGFGCQSLPKGKCYIGQFQNDESHGRGVLFYPDGMLYTGLWKQGYIQQLELLFEGLNRHLFVGKGGGAQSNTENMQKRAYPSRYLKEIAVKNLATPSSCAMKERPLPFSQSFASIEFPSSFLSSEISFLSSLSAVSSFEQKPLPPSPVCVKPPLSLLENQNQQLTACFVPTANSEAKISFSPYEATLRDSSLPEETPYVRPSVWSDESTLPSPTILSLSSSTSMQVIDDLSLSAFTSSSDASTKVYVPSSLSFCREDETPSYEMAIILASLPSVSLSSHPSFSSVSNIPSSPISNDSLSEQTCKNPPLLSTLSPSTSSSLEIVVSLPFDESKHSRIHQRLRSNTADSLHSVNSIFLEEKPPPHGLEAFLQPHTFCIPYILPFLWKSLPRRIFQSESIAGSSCTPLQLADPSSPSTLTVIPSSSSLLPRQPLLLSFNSILPSSFANIFAALPPLPPSSFPALPPSTTRFPSPSSSFPALPPLPPSSFPALPPSITRFPPPPSSPPSSFPPLPSSTPVSPNTETSSSFKARKNSLAVNCLGWNQDEVCYFLYCIGFQKFAALFRYHRIEGDILPWITEASLQDMAIPLWEERRCLLLAIDLLLKERHFSVHCSSYSPVKLHTDPNLSLFEIPAEDLILEEAVGEGSYGTVYRASWMQKHLFAPPPTMETMHSSCFHLQEDGQREATETAFLQESSRVDTKRRSSEFKKSKTLSSRYTRWPLSHRFATTLSVFTSILPFPIHSWFSKTSKPSFPLAKEVCLTAQTPDKHSLPTDVLPSFAVYTPQATPSLERSLHPTACVPLLKPPCTLSGFFSSSKPSPTSLSPPKLFPSKPLSPPSSSPLSPPPPLQPSTMCVAVKVFRHSDNRALLRNFYSELSILTRLRHPNITLFLGIILSPQYCLVTEYIPNGSLFDLLHVELITLSFKQCLCIAMEICCGMMYLHHHGILHCDLKSSNILISEYGHVKICDFGLASLAEWPIEEDLPRHMGCIGSLHWMAPEVLRGEGMTKASDVYSFGVILWEMLIREIPRANIRSPNHLLVAVGYGAFTIIPPKGLHPLLFSILSRCLSIQPEKRCTFDWCLHQLSRLLDFTTVEEPLKLFMGQMDVLPEK
ncbi:Tyrosine kinase-like (TKL) protein [Cardiosporidium cionae]|uniref:Tyrosine kinase-like (TKL) protein n=1 Tax=Cardiosporidium cionae TaxID=476202 RepID=A0ABQ7JCS2_9APIC|nr:Tyrosine kinase-like (TKL) protein [Cardiosporidium cionae]|eukprot:KAF8821822.1 Tyrosine kinase-like (TKL) protein [Cardiosporidium cionae]